MKYVLLSTLFLMSSLSFADDPKLERHAQLVRVGSVIKEVVGQGHPSTKLKVTATFSNSCVVPNSDELVAITQYSKDFRNLDIALGYESHRVCPAVYKPVTVTIDLGTYTKPNDGLFERITVNGKGAQYELVKFNH